MAQLVNGTRSEQEGDRRVVAAVAALVLLLLIVAGIVAVAAMAYRDDGKGGLLGTKKASFTWPATAPAFEAKHLTAAPTSAWLTNGGSTYNQRYSPLDEINTENVEDLKGVWMTDLDGSGHRGEVLGRGAADRLRRRHLRPDRRRRRLRGRRRDRQDPLAVRRQARPEDQHGLLRLAEPRRRARRRHGLPRPARRQPRRARPEDRQAGLDDARSATGRRATRSRPRPSTTTGS